LLSNFSGGPGNWMLLLWVIVGWITELTVVIFLIQSFLGGLANLDEVGKVLSVGEVLIEVILEVLKKVHVLLNEVVSSDSWERESIIIKLPGVNENSWVQSLLLNELFIDLHGIVVMLSVASSGEVVELDVKVLNGDLKSLFAWLVKSRVQLNVQFEVWLIVSDFDSGGNANECKGSVEFHFFY
jgi:hypothetical protein